MLYLDIDRLVRLHGQKHPISYLTKDGDFTKAEARTLMKKGGPREIKLTMVVRLCSFFHCREEALYNWNGDDNHVLAYLRKPPVPDFATATKGMSPEEIERWIWRMMEGKG
jgi:hypothetical protein